MPGSRGVSSAENPMACVAIGAGKALENYAVMRRSLPET